MLLPLHSGFIDHENKLLCYTDHQLFERYHKFKLKAAQNYKKTITLDEITNLEIGDFVTHIDHGVGKFGGLQKIDVQGKKQEAIKLIYRNNDLLYVSIHSLHKIAKFNGKDGIAPKIHQRYAGKTLFAEQRDQHHTTEQRIQPGQTQQDKRPR